MNNLIEVKKDIADLQKAMNQHGGLINALLQQKGTQESKLECMKQLNAAEFENVEAYMDGVKKLFGWLTGRDVELENTRNTLNAVNKQLAEAKTKIETLEKDNKALVKMTEGLEKENTDRLVLASGKIVAVPKKEAPDADGQKLPETEDAHPEGDHAGGQAGEEGAPEAPEQEGVKDAAQPDPVQ